MPDHRPAHRAGKRSAGPLACGCPKRARGTGVPIGTVRCPLRFRPQTLRRRRGLFRRAHQTRRRRNSSERQLAQWATAPEHSPTATRLPGGCRSRSRDGRMAPSPVLKQRLRTGRAQGPVGSAVGQPAARELRGPAISQMMNPRSGSSRRTQRSDTFAPDEADDPTMPDDGPDVENEQDEPADGRRIPCRCLLAFEHRGKRSVASRVPTRKDRKLSRNQSNAAPCCGSEPAVGGHESATASREKK